MSRPGLDAGALPRKVLFLVPRLDKASTRYRVLQYLPALAEAGIACELRAVSKIGRDWPRLLWQAYAADVVFIQKKLFSLFEIALLRRVCRRLIYDFDDAVMFKDGPASDREHARQRHRFAVTARRADLLIAGNAYLDETARCYNHTTVMLPTPLDMARYTKRPAKTDDNVEVVLGWIGSRGTLKYLAEIAPALEVLGERLPGITLKIVADDFFDLAKLPVIKKNWSEDEEIADLHSFDIGLMPLPDDVWTRGKCGFKLLQCMAVGLPVICSPVGANREIVTDGVEGFWAARREEWVEKIALLAGDAALRATLGRRGREQVARRYSLRANLPLFLRALRRP